MPKEYSRTQRVSDLMQRELATILQTEVRDPRFAAVTIVEVRVTRDLGYAKIYATVLEDDKAAIQATIAALNKAAPFLRHLLAERIELRIMPQLIFVYDESLQNGMRISSLLNLAEKSKSDKTDE